ncbi:HlyD family secretion protein [Yoonia sp.]|uniref:HlyD family secretion protein n=1 Tax=Yoonia sp. TaxID=2212373 RepID=UPI003F6C5D0D
MKRKLSIGFAVLGVILAGVAGYLWWQASQSGGPPAFARANGRVEADLVDVATEITGRIAVMHVQEGELVDAADPIARIDTKSLQARLDRARADVAAAEGQVAQARAVIDQNEAALKFSQVELERASTLLERGFGTQEAVDSRRSDRDADRATLAAARASLTAAERQVDAARAVVLEIETQIADAQIVAPVRGRVLYRLAEPGEVVASGAPVVTLVDLSRVYMEVFLPTALAARVGIGAEARISLDGINLVIPAHVSFVSPDAQFTPETVETQDVRADLMFRIRLRVNQDLIERNIDYVKTGMRGTGHIRLAGSDDVAWPDGLTLTPRPPLAAGD